MPEKPPKSSAWNDFAKPTLGGIVILFAGYAIATMQDRYTGSQAKSDQASHHRAHERHENEPWHGQVGVEIGRMQENLKAIERTQMEEKKELRQIRMVLSDIMRLQTQKDQDTP